MNDKKLLICYMGSKGGGSQYAFLVAKELKKYFKYIDAILLDNNELLDEWKRLKLNKLFLLKSYRGNKDFIIKTLKLFFSSSHQIKRHFKNTIYDYAYIPMTGLWTGKVLSFIKYKELITTIHDPKPHSSFPSKTKTFFISLAHRLLKYDIAKKSNRLIILSDCFYEFIREKYRKDTYVIPLGNSIDNQLIQINTKQQKEGTHFLFFGRIDKYKGIPLLINAFNDLKKIYKSISLSIVGNGDLSCLHLENYDLTDICIINRWIKDSEISYFFTEYKFTVTILPYLDATQSGVIPIAQSLESLVVCSNAGGLVSQVDGGKSGILFEANNIQDLKEKMASIIENPAKYAEIISNAKNSVTNNSWENIADKINKAIIG